MTDFQVAQTYDEIGAAIYEAVVDVLTDTGEHDRHLPVPPELQRFAEGVARQVRDGVLRQLDEA